MQLLQAPRTRQDTGSDKLVNETLQARNSEIVRQFVGLPRIFVGKMSPRNFDQGRKGQPFLESMSSPVTERFVHENRRVLVKIGDLASNQKNQPSDIKPDENDHDSKSVDGSVLSGVSHKRHESHPTVVATSPALPMSAELNAFIRHQRKEM
jgi:hypothetical protein